MEVKVNGKKYTLNVDPNMPLLWVLRDELGLVGTKYSCGIGSCGACKVLIGNNAIQSCLVRIGDVQGEVITIEGVSNHVATSDKLIDAWIEHQVAQCGYCQPGQIINAISMLSRYPDLNDDIIDRETAGNLCRCGTYPRIREALKSAVQTIRSHDNISGRNKTD